MDFLKNLELVSSVLTPLITVFYFVIKIQINHIKERLTKVENIDDKILEINKTLSYMKGKIDIFLEHNKAQK